MGYPYLTIVQLVKAPENCHQLHGCHRLDVHTCVATTHKNPRCFIRGHFVTIRLRKHNILRKVVKVVDSLLNCVEFQALGFQIINGVA